MKPTACIAAGVTLTTGSMPYGLRAENRAGECLGVRRRASNIGSVAWLCLPGERAGHDAHCLPHTFSVQKQAKPGLHGAWVHPAVLFRKKPESEKWELGYRPTENGTALVGRLVADGKDTC